MKTKTIYSKINLKVSYILAILLITVSFISCDNDDDAQLKAPYFSIEENPTGLSAGVAGVTKSYVVRSNRPWKLVDQGNSEWVKVFPEEGNDDGIFKVTIKDNITFDSRIANYAFFVDGKEQPILFRVEQEANVPFIKINNATNGISVPSAKTSFNVSITSNVIWTYTIENGDWLTQESLSENSITLNAAKNIGELRTATLNIKSSQYPNLDKQIIINQSSGNIILEENFDWLSYGSEIFYNTSGETRMDSWTADELNRGWTSTVSAVAGNQMVVYGRTGFLKLGKTGYGGDLISRKLSSLEETSNLLVKFKAVPYKTAGGTEDDNILRLSVVGPGTVNISSLTIDNWPDYATDPECIKIWQSEASNYQFTVTGATSETQIRFLGGAFELVGVGKGKNRIFLDNIKVEITE
ncbi:BACON domain-containing protein [Mariniflexile sp.]|uniref:BACON domain-containing protein n=1 Tax=Mariniflexile sp. TaxID=1979402 RepID=UPI004048AC6C